MSGFWPLWLWFHQTFVSLPGRIITAVKLIGGLHPTGLTVLLLIIIFLTPYKVTFLKGKVYITYLHTFRVQP